MRSEDDSRDIVDPGVIVITRDGGGGVGGAGGSSFGVTQVMM